MPFNVGVTSQPQIGHVSNRLASPTSGPTLRPQCLADRVESATGRRASANAGGVLCEADQMQGVTVTTKDVAELRVADADGLCQHRIEHRLQMARRAADDLEHF